MSWGFVSPVKPQPTPEQPKSPKKGCWQVMLDTPRIFLGWIETIDDQPVCRDGSQFNEGKTIGDATKQYGFSWQQRFHVMVKLSKTNKTVADADFMKRNF